VKNDEAKAQVEQFAKTKRGWSMFDQASANPYAGRAFEYPKSSATALLSLRAVDGRSIGGAFIAQLNLPFSAGPESQCQGSLDECIKWLTRHVLILEVPFALKSAKSMNEAKYLLNLFNNHAIWVLAAVFDLDEPSARGDLLERFGPVHTTPDLLMKFVTGRHHWRLAQDSTSGWYGWRVMYPFDQTCQLRISPSNDKPHTAERWSTVVFNALGDQVAALVGSYAEVSAEVIDVQKTLSVIDELYISRSASQAWSLMTAVRGERLEMLRKAYELPRGAADKVRRNIIKHVTGMAVDPDQVTA
jgi:hypothetical protein